MYTHYPGDLIGYGRNAPNANRLNKLRIAVQFAFNYEESEESCVLYSGAPSETFLYENHRRATFSKATYEHGVHV